MIAADDHEALLAEIRGEAEERILSRFDHTDARRLGQEVARIAERDGLAVVVSVRRGAQTAYHAAFPGTTAEHDDWVRRKINTVLLHEVPSLEFVLRHLVAGSEPGWLDPQQYAIAGGALPVTIDGHVVGVVAVSGLVGSAREDHDLAMAGLRTLRALRALRALPTDESGAE